MDERIRLLIGYDGSECADAALDEIRLAGLPPDAEATVQTTAEVWLPPPETDDGIADTFPLQVPAGVKHAWRRAEEALSRARQTAEAACERLRRSFPGWSVTAEAASGSPAWELLRRADESRADLVVVGSHGRSALGRLLLGSVSQKVLAEARCSVRLARRAPGRVPEDDSPPRIIVAVDGSPDALAAVAEVATRRWAEGTAVRIITAAEFFVGEGGMTLPPPHFAGAFQRDAAHALGSAGLHVTSDIREGDPRRVLLEEAETWGADCIFLGAKGHRFLERTLLGSVSYAVAARALCSVEVVRSADG